MIRLARSLRSDMTLLERRVWRKLQILNRQGSCFRRQVPFQNYILDFVDHSARLVIELDGAQHGEDQRRLRDMVRDEFIRNEGYCVLRFWNHEVIEDLEAVVDLIYRVARERYNTKAG